MVQLIGTFNIIYWIGWISTELALKGFPKADLGYAMGANEIFYLLSCLALPFFSDYFPRRLMFVIAMFSLGLTMLLMGPSALFHFPDELWVMLAAFPLLGVSQVFVYPTIIPEIIERLTIELGIEEGKDEYVDTMLNDKASECFGFCWGLIMFLGPLTGSWMYTGMGAKKTTDSIALLDFFLGAILLIFNCGFSVFNEND